jgi:hypothetical protein
MSSADPPTPPEWGSLSGGVIYDRLITKGEKLGTQVNKILRDLQSKTFASTGVGLLLGKSKEERTKQRVFFMNLSEAGLQFVRMQMKTHSGGHEAEVDDDAGLDPEDVPACLRARCMHMAEDPASEGFLEVIFGGVTKKARREQLDEKSTRTVGIWKTLSDDFFDNANWKPENTQTDSRVQSIQPGAVPAVLFGPEKLRTLFSELRTQYTIFSTRFHASGQVAEGEDHGEGDDDFFVNYVRGDIVFFYMHLLFKGKAPRYCLRDLEASQKSDVGCSDNVSVLTSSGKKRAASEDREMFQEMFQRTEVENDRDKAMGEYYTSLTRSNELDSLSTFISASSFTHLTEELQEGLREKLAKLVKEKFLV